MHESPPPQWHPGLIALFVLIGAMIYSALLMGSEWLTYRQGDRNPFFRIITAEQSHHDWIILGASHAMPLDFADTGAMIEAETGLTLRNLAATGTGPLIHRLIAARYLADHDAGGVLIVADGFGFASRQWNEDRLNDGDFMPRIPWDRRLVAIFGRAMADGLPVTTWLDYVTGFSKINNRDRFARDTWQAAENFARAARPSDLADRQRIDYLYPDAENPKMLARYMREMVAIIGLAQAQGAQVVVVRPPLPDRFRNRLPPQEAAFDALLRETLAAQGVTLHDFSTLLPATNLYFDTDHLNRAGVEAWLNNGLGAVLKALK